MPVFFLIGTAFALAESSLIGEIGVETGTLFVGESIGTVIHVCKGNVSHEGLSFERTCSRILKNEPASCKSNNLQSLFDDSV